MNDMPDEIWAYEQSPRIRVWSKRESTHHHSSYKRMKTQYTRTDLVTAKDAEIAALRDALKVAREALELESERTGPECYTLTLNALSAIVTLLGENK